MSTAKPRQGEEGRERPLEQRSSSLWSQEQAVRSFTQDLPAREPPLKLTELSYKLRTPLGTMMGYAEMLREELSEAGLDALCDTVDLMHEAGQDLLTQIQAFERAAECEQRLHRLANALHGLPEQLLEKGEEHELPCLLLSKLADALPASTIWLLVRGDDDTGWMERACWRQGMPGKEEGDASCDEACLKGDVLKGLTAELDALLLKQHPTIISDSKQAPFPLPVPDKVNAWICMPLLAQTAEPMLLLLAHEQREGFSEQDRRIAAEATNLIEISLHNAQRIGEVHRLAERDALTGVNNRRSFFAQANVLFEQIRQCYRPIAVVMVDLDHFKQVNDTYGHLVGDIVLKEVAVRLRRSLRDGDLLARFGGEEFVILLVDTIPEMVGRVAERLRQQLSAAPIQVSDTLSLEVTMSIGAAPYWPDEELPPGQELHELLVRADEALYEAKESGRNRVVVR